MSFRKRYDVNMDEQDSGPRITGPGQQLNQLAQRTVEQNLISIEVKNWQGASVDDLLFFLSRKTRIPLLNAKVEGDAVVGYVRSESDAQSLVKWSGVRFASNSLKISKQANQATSSTIELLKRFLNRRYKKDAKLLDLTNIASDSELQQNGAFSSISTQSKMFPALMKLASQENFDVESVSLSENNLEDLAGVTTLSQTYPKLINLAITNNRITRLRSLEIWKNKLRFLRELHLSNNPICTDVNYKNEIAKLFPKLVILDGVVIRDENKLHAIYQLPFLRKQFFFEDAETQQLCTQFISNFLQLWDTDRSQLLQLYTPESQFSISVDSSVPNDAAASNVAFGYYIPISRNLSRVSSEKTRRQRLGKGPQEIMRLFQSIPKTKHKLTEAPDLYSVESWRYQQVNGFIISLHGEYQETGAPETDTNASQARGHRRGAITTSSSNRLTPKSFDRTFVIVPSSSTLIIASELLIVRPIANANAWDEKDTISTPSASQISQVTSTITTPVSVSAPAAIPNIQLPPGVNITQEQKAIVTKLHIETKLNLQFTLLLAEQSNWNYENALQSFKESHMNGQIPPEAFQ